MAQSLPIPTVEENRPADPGFEADVRRWGERVFDLMDAAERPFWLSQARLYGALMDRAMQDEHFKTRLFRFVDVLPSLGSSGAVAAHLREYLGDPRLKLATPLRLALRVSVGFPWIVSAGLKTQIAGLARQFMLGDDPKSITSILHQRSQQGLGFTVDVLGERVLSETEADQYASRYVQTLDLLARETPLRSEAQSNAGSRGPAPRLNLSIKISALYSQIDPTDPERAVDRISARLRPILQRARQAGALINFDMEQYALKNLTLRLFKRIFTEPEFAREPAAGLAMQAYLRDSESDLLDVIAWAERQNRRITIRLVKGAYWDYEMVVARQKGWPIPVFTRKAESDANFERLSTLLLENEAAVEPAFGTHNVRSVAAALARAERLGVHPHGYEFQMLYGMADPLKSALIQLGRRVREYCPIGELLPGMAYLVRRLLENSSNEGFLARNRSRSVSRQELLDPPHVLDSEPRVERSDFRSAPAREDHLSNGRPRIQNHRDSAEELASPLEERGDLFFRNEPPTDFTIPAERDKMRAALQNLRLCLGETYPLIINNRSVPTKEWLPSLNPANQNEVIGYAAQATISEAEAALVAAKAAQIKWARTLGDRRAALLERVANLLRRDRAVLSALEILEAGKNWSEADADVAEAIDFCGYYAAVMRQLASPELTQSVPGESNLQEWWARGTGLVIAPWNFPLAILTGMTMAAVVTGNSVLMKPSDQTPVLAARLMKLILEAGLPPGVVNLVTGPGSTVGAHLVAHPKVDFIAFTGSKEVGLRIWEAAGRTPPGQSGLKKVVCEMGGKNAIIIDSDADLDEAVHGTIVSAFGYQGQKCSALSRLIVLEGNYERLLKRLIEASAALQVGPAEQPGNVLGPVISREAQQRILQVIEAGRSEATLTWQGSVPDDPNACYVPPTIFTDVPPGSRLFREEIFGPVLSVTRARNFEEALHLANASEFALTGGVYSRSPANIERARAEFVCGNLYINRHITGAIVERQPFGGFKMSGGGTKAGGREYLLNFVVPRVVTENCLRRGFAPIED